MKVKHQYILTVYEDDTVKHEFPKFTGWGVGKFERHLSKAFSALRQEHAKLAAKQREEERKQNIIKEQEQAEADAQAHQRRALAAAVANGSVEVAIVSDDGGGNEENGSDKDTKNPIFSGFNLNRSEK